MDLIKVNGRSGRGRQGCEVKCDANNETTI